MDLMRFFVSAISLLVIVIHNGEIARRMLSKEKDLELDRELSLLNKPPIKTFQHKMGDIIDCIDMHKQPAFDHTLLKNHKIQLRPSLPQGSVANYTRTMSKAIESPEGSIPIRRTTKEDLIRAILFTESYASLPSIHSLLAIMRSKFRPKVVYKGIAATISVDSPVVKANQSSTAQVCIQNGDPSIVNRLEVGWMVSPALFGDGVPRSFTNWKVNGRFPKGCFNLLCAGFVQTDRTFILGGPLESSTYGANGLKEINYMIFQDYITLDWWFHDATHNITVGYLPKTLFPLLALGVSQVTWGGSTMGQPNGASPEMGSGHFPGGDFLHGCINNMLVVDTKNYWVDPADPYYQMETFVDDTTCYNVKYYDCRGER